MEPRLKELYFKEIQPALKNQLGLKNLYMGPKIKKIVLNMGLGIDGNDSKILKSCQEDIAKITGQKPVITKFKKSVANFKTRKGSNAGLKVTLTISVRLISILDILVMLVEVCSFACILAESKDLSSILYVCTSSPSVNSDTDL